MKDIITMYEIESDKKEKILLSSDFFVAQRHFKNFINNFESLQPKANNLFLVEKQYASNILLNKKILAIYSEITESTIFKDC